MHLYWLDLLIQTSKRKLLLKIDLADFRIQKFTGVHLRNLRPRTMTLQKYNELKETNTRLGPQGNEDLGTDNCEALVIRAGRRGLGDQHKSRVAESRVLYETIAPAFSNQPEHCKQ